MIPCCPGLINFDHSAGEDIGTPRNAALPAKDQSRKDKGVVAGEDAELPVESCGLLDVLLHIVEIPAGILDTHNVGGALRKAADRRGSQCVARSGRNVVHDDGHIHRRRNIHVMRIQLFLGCSGIEGGDNGEGVRTN